MFKKLTREQIQELDLPKADKKFALLSFDNGASVMLLGETEDGYTLGYLYTPTKH